MSRQWNLFNSRVETGPAALISMLQTKRPAGTKSEQRFLEEWVAPLGTTADGYGNHSLRIGDVPVLWSCHTDTVHDKGGKQGLILVNKRGIKTDPSCRSNCLGADDTAGVWLMREMILAKVPGLYVFHRAEEIGCKGSSWIADHAPDMLKGIKFAIAFDRKGDDEVITHQGLRSCSDKFAQSLADQLGMNYKPSDRGIYTDTREYTDLVGECTNIGVGYYNQHSRDEWLDVEHILKLRAVLLTIDTSKLVAERNPGEVEYKTYHYSGGYYHGGYGWDGYDMGWGDWEGAYQGMSKTDAEGNRHYSYKVWDKAQGKMVDKTYTVKADTYKKYYTAGAATPYKSNLPANVQPKPDAGVTKQYHAEDVTAQARAVLDRHDRKTGHTAFTTRAGNDEGVTTTLDRGKNNFDALLKLCRNHPDEVADLFEAYGIDAEELAEHILQTVGYVDYR